MDARRSRGGFALPLRRAALFQCRGRGPARAVRPIDTERDRISSRVACQTALGKRDRVQVFGTDYPTPDGSCLRDYIQVGDLAHAHLLALRYLRQGGESRVLNCGYGRGYSVLEVIDMVKRVSGIDFPVEMTGRRAGDPAALVAQADRIQACLGWQPENDDLETIVRQALEWERGLT